MKQVFFLFAFALLSLAACTDPITVGSDILTGDQADVGQVNNLPVTVRTVREDSIRVFGVADNAYRQSFSFGQSNDDVFGKWTHAVSLVPGLQVSTATVLQQVVIPEFVTDGPTLVDSIVLILPIDTFTGFYGVGRTFPVRMTRLLSPFPTDQDVYSTYERPATGEDLFDGDSFTATAEATILYDTLYTQNGDTIRDPHVRLRMTQSFVDEINALDSTSFASDTIFRDVFAGVYLEPLEGADAFLAIQPRARGAGVAERSGFYFFYPDPSDSDPASFYRAPLEGWFPRYSYDYSGSQVADLLAGTDNTRTAVGGTASFMTAVTFTDLDVLQDRLVNRAEITFFREALEDYDYELFPEPGFLGLYYRNNSGELINILDQALLQTNNDAVRNFLGGFAEMDANDEDLIFYRNRLSVHMQGIVDGNFAEPTIYLRVVPIASDPARAILGGPASPNNPPTNTVTFTVIN